LSRPSQAKACGPLRDASARISRTPAVVHRQMITGRRWRRSVRRGDHQGSRENQRDCCAHHRVESIPLELSNLAGRDFGAVVSRPRQSIQTGDAIRTVDALGRSIREDPTDIVGCCTRLPRLASPVDDGIRTALTHVRTSWHVVEAGRPGIQCWFEKATQEKVET
jgi:hypothetical protein